LQKQKKIFILNKTYIMIEPIEFLAKSPDDQRSGGKSPSSAMETGKEITSTDIYNTQDNDL
jgi:hypothetical protein